MLLAKTQLTEAHGHLTASPESTKRIVGVIKDLVRTIAARDSKTSIPFRTIHQLWKVMKLVFCQGWLSETSDDILKVVSPLYRDSDIADICPELEEFCVALFSSSTVDTLASHLITHVEAPHRRRLWTLIVDDWRTAEPLRPWHGIAIFLSIPLR